MRRMYKDEHTREFKDELKKQALSWDKAWEARNFEIQMYWKRAAYFWAFQVAIFAGYFAVSRTAKNADDWVIYLLSNVGLIITVAWHLVNKGSKTWQENWESHIDMLEDELTGPLYKTVAYRDDRPSFSVSRINEMVSGYFIFAWLGLCWKYWYDESLFNSSNFTIDWVVLVISIVTFGTSWHMWKNKRTNKKEPTFKLELREPNQE